MNNTNDIRVKWEDLTPQERVMAVSNYMAVRTIEEEEECNWGRALTETPFCRAFYRMSHGGIEVDI